MISDIEPDCLVAKYNRNKISLKSRDKKKYKSEKNQRRDDEVSSEWLQTCTIMVGTVLAYDMNHTKNLKVKDLMVLICYHSE